MAAAPLLSGFELGLRVVNALNLTVCILNPWIILPFRPISAQRAPKRWSITLLPVVSYAILEPLSIWASSVVWSMPPFITLVSMSLSPCISHAIRSALPSEEAERKLRPGQGAPKSTGNGADTAAIIEEVNQQVKVVRTFAALWSVFGTAITNSAVLLLGPSLQETPEDARAVIAGVAAFALLLTLACRITFGEYRIWTRQPGAFVDGGVGLFVTVIINLVVLQVIRASAFYALGLDVSIILKSVGRAGWSKA